MQASIIEIPFETLLAEACAPLMPCGSQKLVKTLVSHTLITHVAIAVPAPSCKINYGPHVTHMTYLISITFIY